MELNERLAQLRKEHGLSQNDLADQLKVSRQAVSRWEQGLAMPSSDNLIYLSKLYGITLDELIYPRDESKEQKTTQDMKEEHIENQKKKNGLLPLFIAVLLGLIIGIAVSSSEKAEIFPIEELEIDIKKSTASLPSYVRESVEREIDLCTETSARVYNSRGSYSKSNVSTPNLDYVWEQRKKNGRYSFHINRKHSLLNNIKKQLDDQGKSTLSAYLALVENFAPFMQSGVTDSLQKGKVGGESDKTSLEYQVQIKELKDMIMVFLSQGFTKEETQSTLLDMANYRHLREEIIRLVEEA